MVTLLVVDYNVNYLHPFLHTAGILIGDVIKQCLTLHKINNEQVSSYNNV